MCDYSWSSLTFLKAFLPVHWYIFSLQLVGDFFLFWCSIVQISARVFFYPNSFALVSLPRILFLSFFRHRNVTSPFYYNSSHCEIYTAIVLLLYVLTQLLANVDLRTLYITPAEIRMCEGTVPCTMCARMCRPESICCRCCTFFVSFALCAVCMASLSLAPVKFQRISALAIISCILQLYMRICFFPAADVFVVASFHITSVCYTARLTLCAFVHVHAGTYACMPIWYVYFFHSF